jgi:O-antigen/teichoic acid export membrane protein
VQKYRTASQLVAAAFNFCLNLWLIPTHGWLGAAWASLITDAALGAMNTFLLAHACRVEVRRMAAQGLVPAKD